MHRERTYHIGGKIFNKADRGDECYYFSSAISCSSFNKDLMGYTGSVDP